MAELLDLPTEIDFGPWVIQRAISSLKTLVKQDPRQPQTYADGLEVAGVDPELSVRYGAAIATTPKVRDVLPQSNFVTGYVVGSAIVSLAREAVNG